MKSDQKRIGRIWNSWNRVTWFDFITPFEETVSSGASAEESIEKIRHGGNLIDSRFAAKNLTSNNSKLQKSSTPIYWTSKRKKMEKKNFYRG